MRLLLIILFSILGVFSIFQFKLIYSSIIVFAILAALLWEFFHFADRTNRDLNQFLLAIRHKDYSGRFPVFKGKAIDELRSTFNVITQDFQRIQLEKDIQHVFLNEIMEKVPVGILGYLPLSGEVILYNQAAKNILGLEFIPEMNFLAKGNPFLFDQISNLVEGRAELSKNPVKSSVEEFSLRLARVQLKQSPCNLILFQTLGAEMDQKEMETWKKFSRVITHEVMNSITPIISLSKTLDKLVDEELRRTESDNLQVLTDIKQGISAIINRSQGLSQFVDEFRKLTRLPDPEKANVKLSEIVGEVLSLLLPELNLKRIKWDWVDESDGRVLFVDTVQLGQALLNILINSIEALNGIPEGKIEVRAIVVQNYLELSVRDNGEGIPPDILDKVLLPFFSTKATGSGIGLSLSRQFVMNNGGSLSIKSNLGYGTQVILRF